METYISDLNSIRSAIVRKCPDRPPPSWVRITTITMCSKFSNEIDIKKFHGTFTEMTIQRKDGGCSYTWNRKDAGFYNQVTICTRDALSKKSVKVFPNGSIQVAGCSDLYDCDRILAQLVIIFRTTLGLDDLTVAPPKVAMINTNFSLNSSVNLNRLISKLKLSSQFRVTFDPDRYSAVKVKFSPRPGQKQVTASIFRTGKIIVTGAQTLDEISGAYEVLNGQVDASLLVKPTQTIETFETILGGRFEDWIEVFKNKNIGT